MVFLFYKNLFLQKSQITYGPAHLHLALTNFRACWKHLTDYGEGQVFLFFLLWKQNRKELQSSS